MGLADAAALRGGQQVAEPWRADCYQPLNTGQNGLLLMVGVGVAMDCWRYRGIRGR